MHGEARSLEYIRARRDQIRGRYTGFAHLGEPLMCVCSLRTSGVTALACVLALTGGQLDGWSIAATPFC